MKFSSARGKETLIASTKYAFETYVPNELGQFSVELLLVTNTLNTSDFTPVLFNLIFIFCEGNHMIACVKFPST